VTITFSEPVTGFELGDLTVSNGTAGNFSGADDVYAGLSLPPTTDGPMTVDIDAGERFR
jgi:hypothetical protein